MYTPAQLIPLSGWNPKLLPRTPSRINAVLGTYRRAHVPRTDIHIIPDNDRNYTPPQTGASFSGNPVTAETRAALAKLAQTLEEVGCDVEKMNPPGFDAE